MNRRVFLKHAGFGALGVSFLPGSLWGLPPSEEQKNLFFTISLAQWSLHRTLFAKTLNHLDFAETAVKKFDIHAVEYVNQFFKDKGTDKDYLKEMLLRSSDLGVRNVLIMVDGEGNLSDPDVKARQTAIENHYKWVEAAQLLGCHAIRVSLIGEEQPEVIQAAAIDGLGKLADFAADYQINVIVENHRGLSSNGRWLSQVLTQVKRDNCGSLPDFGNFYEYDRYQGVQDMMPFAKGISAKTHAFTPQGEESGIDFLKMMRIVRDAGYQGYVGIEYEGRTLTEDEGIRKTKALLERVGQALS